jgi:hypothetical protein
VHDTVWIDQTGATTIAARKMDLTMHFPLTFLNSGPPSSLERKRSSNDRPVFPPLPHADFLVPHDPMLRHPALFPHDRTDWFRVHPHAFNILTTSNNAHRFDRPCGDQPFYMTAHEG